MASASQGGTTSTLAGLGDLLVYIKDLRAPAARKRRLFVKSWHTVKDVKVRAFVIVHMLSLRWKRLRLQFGALLLLLARLARDFSLEGPARSHAPWRLHHRAAAAERTLQAMKTVALPRHQSPTVQAAPCTKARQSFSYLWSLPSAVCIPSL